MDIESARQDGVPCVNRGCKWWIDDADAQNCGGEYSDGDPCVSRCKEYCPLDTKEGEQLRTTGQVQNVSTRIAHWPGRYAKFRSKI